MKKKQLYIIYSTFIKRKSDIEEINMLCKHLDGVDVNWNKVDGDFQLWNPKEDSIAKKIIKKYRTRKKINKTIDKLLK